MPINGVMMLGLVAPALLVAVMMAIGWGLRRRDSAIVGGWWAGALAFPIGYGFAHWILVAPPRLTGIEWSIVDANSRVWLVAPLGLVAGLIGATRAPGWVRGIVVLLAGLVSGWLLVGSVHPDYLGGWARHATLVAVGIGTWSTWFAIERDTDRHRWHGLVTALILALVSPPLIGLVGKIGVFALASTALGGMVIAAAGMSLINGRATVARGASPTIALALTTIWFASSVLLHGYLETPLLVLLVAAPAVPGVLKLIGETSSRVRGACERRSWLPVVLRLTAMLVPLLIVAVLALRVVMEKDANPYGY